MEETFCFTVDMIATGAQIKALMKENHISVKKLSEYLCVGDIHSVYDWINGDTFPSFPYLFAMSRVFDVTIESFVVMIETQ